MIYLDHNATAPVKPEAIRVMAEAIQAGPLNPSSVHSAGRMARKIVEQARTKIATVFGAEGADVIFTSGGTEANNLAICGLEGYNVMVSAVEHYSVLKPAREAKIIPVGADGAVDLRELEIILKRSGGKCFVSIMLANNETGVIQPVREIARLTHDFGGIVHSDVVQAAGKIPVSLGDLGVDMMTVSSHKFGGPQGAGALIVKKEIAVSPMISGGGQEFGLRAGTENVPAIAGFGVAAELLPENLRRMEEIKVLRTYMEKEIKSFAEDAKIFGESAERLANTSCISMPNVKAELQLIEFDLAGICISSGAACSSGKVLVSHVLQAMGVAKPEAETAVRVSLGIDNTKAEIDEFIAVWKNLYARVNGQKLAA